MESLTTTWAVKISGSGLMLDASKALINDETEPVAAPLASQAVTRR
jgi:hypothetical protein